MPSSTTFGYISVEASAQHSLRPGANPPAPGVPSNDFDVSYNVNEGDAVSDCGKIGGPSCRLQVIKLCQALCQGDYVYRFLPCGQILHRREDELMFPKPEVLWL